LAVEALSDGMPGLIHPAHILPPEKLKNGSVKILPKTKFRENGLNFLEFISNLEDEIRRKTPVPDLKEGFENAIMVTSAQKNDDFLEESIEETKELAKTCNVNIVDIFTQYRNDPDPKYLIGKGKLQDLILRAMELDASLLLFNQNLSPSLARRISTMTNLKILDRTQLILDVFAQRAKSGDGKLQVELAQLKYTLPRLVEKDTMMSRLTGGIGGRGPGETKLEINRRRAQERIGKLSKQIKILGKKRAQKRSARNRNNIPIVSIVGYTNAGKSTLLNHLTKSEVRAENRPFSTLDPASRRLRFPKEREIVITDTVGFIRDLPPDLLNAFRATLEEIGDADLMLHIIDISNPNYRGHIESVDRILKELNYHTIPRLLIANKIDQADPFVIRREKTVNGAIPLSAININTFNPLLEKMEGLIWPVPKVTSHE